MPRHPPSPRRPSSSATSRLYEVAAEAAAAVAPFQYGPNVNVAFSAYNDEFAKARRGKSKAAFLEAVGAMQQITVDDLESSGFSVAE
ncbi:hypothetical protein [Agromyces flavus]|uniref:hypothetical protein n=1 Tax=Agromyces flavus TaxID=589382 RepID=UPI0036061B6B